MHAEAADAGRNRRPAVLGGPVPAVARARRRRFRRSRGAVARPRRRACDGRATSSSSRSSPMSSNGCSTTCRRSACRAPDEVARCNEHGMPPLNFQSARRDPQWRNALRHLLRAAGRSDDGQAPPRSWRALEGSPRRPLRGAGEQAAGGRHVTGLDIADAPLIAAGLQVYFTHLVDHARGRVRFRGSTWPTICPCCGSGLPRASRGSGGDRATASCIARCATRNGTWCASSAAIAKARRASATTGSTTARRSSGKRGESRGLRRVRNAISRSASWTAIRRSSPCADDLATLPLDLLVGGSGQDAVGCQFHADPRRSGRRVNWALGHGDPSPRAVLSARAPKKKRRPGRGAALYSPKRYFFAAVGVAIAGPPSSSPAPPPPRPPSPSRPGSSCTSRPSRRSTWRAAPTPSSRPPPWRPPWPRRPPSARRPSAAAAAASPTARRSTGAARRSWRRRSRQR